MEQVFEIEVSQRKMAAGQKTAHEQNLSATASYASPKWQKQWDQTGSLAYTVYYSWWKNTFLALASKSLSSKSQLVCGRRVLAARVACFGKSGEREIWMQETCQSNFGTEEVEMGWMTWEYICLLAAWGSLLAKQKYSSHPFTFRDGLRLLVIKSTQ